MRHIENIVPAEKINMGGFIVDQPLPTNKLDYHDPFLLIHHANHNHRGGKKSQDVGVGPHPHRGFSPVTFIFQGDVHHRDSRGNNVIVSEGGMQWMSAGMGIIHSERPSIALAEKGGRMEIIQVWVNTPEENKMDQPYYLPIHEKDLSLIVLDEGKVTIRLYAGSIEGKSGPAKVPFPLSMIRIDMKEGGQYTYESNPNENLLIYQLNGTLIVNDHELHGKQMIAFQKKEGDVRVEAKEDSQFIILSGKPIQEPVAKHGPFVMNNETQLLEAMRDYQMGKMGFLVEEF